MDLYKKILVVNYYPMRFNLKSYEDLIMGWSRFIEFVREKMWMQFLVKGQAKVEIIIPNPVVF